MSQQSAKTDEYSVEAEEFMYTYPESDDEQVGRRRRRIESDGEEGSEPDDAESLGGASADQRDADEEQDGSEDELPYNIEYDVSAEGRLERQGVRRRIDQPRAALVERVLAHQERRRPDIVQAQREVAARVAWELPIPENPVFTCVGTENAPPGFRFRTTPRAAAPVVAPVDAPVPGEDEREVDEDQFADVNPAFSSDHKGSSRGFRRFVGTLNNPSLTEFQDMLGKLTSSVWAVAALEVGAGGTPHIQFTARFKDAKTRSAWSKMFPHAWIAASRGTESHCEVYCKKGGCYVEVHRANFSPGQGARMDLEAAAIAVRDNGSAGLQSVIREAPQTFVRFHGGLTALARLTASTRNLAVNPQVHWFIGESGSGKSTAAEAACAAAHPGEPVYHMNVTAYKWVPNYKGQRIIMIHDWRGTNGSGQAIPLNFWLGMFDKFAFEFEEKGGTVPCMAEHIYVSSIHHPNSGHEYKDTPREPLIQLLRRITLISECRRRAGTPIGSVDPLDYTVAVIGNGTVPWPPPLAQPACAPAI
jgi:hypothetical protein